MTNKTIFNLVVFVVSVAGALYTNSVDYIFYGGIFNYIFQPDK